MSRPISFFLVASVAFFWAGSSSRLHADPVTIGDLDRSRTYKCDLFNPLFLRDELGLAAAPTQFGSDSMTAPVASDDSPPAPAPQRLPADLLALLRGFDGGEDVASGMAPHSTEDVRVPTNQPVCLSAGSTDPRPQLIAAVYSGSFIQPPVTFLSGPFHPPRVSS
jgi:hypothetical protein